MLVVTVEIWPGGRVLQRHVIATMNLANVSDLTNFSDYEGFIDGDPVSVKHHRRSDGAWELVRKALNGAKRGR